MTLHVDFDRDLWLYIPTEWPWESYPSLDAWSQAIADAMTVAYGYDRAMQDWVRSVVEGMSRGAGADEHRFGYLSRPHEDLGMASIYELPSTPASEAEMLGLAPDASAAQSFAGGRLGTGLVAARRQVGEDGSDTAVTHWLWRRADRDVLMIAGDPDPARFERLRPAYDALARSIALLD